MASNECTMYLEYRIYKKLTLRSRGLCALVDLQHMVKLNARRQVIKQLAVGLFERKLLLPIVFVGFIRFRAVI